MEALPCIDASAIGIGDVGVAVVIVIAIIVGFVILQRVVSTLSSKGIDAADRLVRRGKYQAGRREVATGLDLVAPIDARLLVERVVVRVNAHDVAPAVVTGLYLKERSGTEVLFAYGSKLAGDQCLAAVTCEPTDTGCQGEYDVLAWTESGADISGVNEIIKMRERIAAVVDEAGGHVTERLSEPDDMAGVRETAALAEREGRPDERSHERTNEDDASSHRRLPTPDAAAPVGAPDKVATTGTDTPDSFTQRTCAKCGSDVYEREQYCTQCGVRVDV